MITILCNKDKKNLYLLYVVVVKWCINNCYHLPQFYVLENAQRPLQLLLMIVRNPNIIRLEFLYINQEEKCFPPTWKRNISEYTVKFAERKE